MNIMSRTLLSSKSIIRNAFFCNLGNCSLSLKQGTHNSHLGEVLGKLSTLVNSRTNLFQHSSVQNFSIQVRVPALGESISDGTIAAILKQAGDAVHEDEALVQIETDKVTLDVRSPHTGHLGAVLVKEGDTVQVGQVIASAEEGEAPSQKEAPPAIKPNAPSPPTVMASSTGKAASLSMEATHTRRHSISFPPRRSPDGQILSMLPADTAEQILRSMDDGQKVRPQPMRASKEFFVPFSVPFDAPPKPRREMSDREMELIMLGGAES